ncbi:MAG: LacI family transcriptional regulator [Gemmatimonadota bacterium]|nr:MAG: LacI family transcriptional regulator [Gemmatimonadota bacterium]
MWASAAALDYWPNGAARSLSTRRTHSIGVLLPDLYGEFYSEIIRGVDEAARNGQLQILISSSHADNEALLAAARSMRGRVDGLIVMAPYHDSGGVVQRIARSFPTVLLNSRLALNGTSAVSIANYDGARAAVSHLAQLGHRRIALVCGPNGNMDAEERRRGYRQALEDEGITPDPAWELHGNFTEASGYEAGLVFPRGRKDPTAVFAANDSMAIGLVSGLLASGRNVPDDVAVIGFDDIALARYVTPPLTTVRVDAHELGMRATTLLTDSLTTTNELPAAHEVLPARLTVRQSCGARPEQERVDTPETKTTGDTQRNRRPTS